MSATAYAIPPAAARMLAAAAVLPQELRRDLLKEWSAEEDADRLIELFCGFIGLANSVVENAREMVELVLVIEGGMHPYTAEKVNLPNIAGALTGVDLAAGIDQARLCGGCAFRLGTPANQSPSTTSDASFCSEPGEDAFLCHENLDDQGQPWKACAGFALRRAALKAA